MRQQVKEPELYIKWKGDDFLAIYKCPECKKRADILIPTNKKKFEECPECHSKLVADLNPAKLYVIKE